MTGTIPREVCAATAVQIMSFRLNRLSGAVPDCVSSMPRLVSLDVSHNELGSVEHGFWTPASPSLLRSLELQQNPRMLLGGVLDVTPAGPAETAAFPVLAKLDVSVTDLGRPAVQGLMHALRARFGALAIVSVRGCGVSGLLGDDSQTPTFLQLDLSENEGITMVYASGMPAVQNLDVGFTAYATGGNSGTERLREFKRDHVPNNDCLARSSLLSTSLDSISLRGALPNTQDLTDERGGATCREQTRPLLEEVPGELSTFGGDGGGSGAPLVCPQWRIASAKIGDRAGFVDADAAFMRYEQCRCESGSVWTWRDEAAGTGECVACDTAGGMRRCDPHVLAPRHCVVGNAYPALVGAGGGRAPRLAERARDLPLARVLLCRRSGVCNIGSDCADRAFDDHSSHSFARDGPGGDGVALGFRCAPGHDPASLLCSRCEPGHWPYGGACMQCHDSFYALVPLSAAAAATALGAYLWRVAGSEPDGFRAASTALFWLQLTSILEASAQAQGAGSARSASVWPWLAAVRGSLETWAVFRPWAASCLSPDFDYLSAAVLTLSAPLALAAAGAALRGVARARYSVAWLLRALLFPVATTALQLFNCESQEGVHFLSAAPYVACEWSGRLLAARALALALLVAYVAPSLVVTWRLLSGARHERVAAARAADLDVPLLSLAEPAAGQENEGVAHAPCDGGRASTLVDALFFASLRDPCSLWWWPVAYSSGRTLALAMVVGLVNETSPLLPVAVFVVLAASALLHVRFHPWKHAGDNALETLVLVAAMSVYLANIVGGATATRRVSDTVALEAAVSLAHLAVLAQTMWVLRAQLLQQRRGK